MNIKEALIAIAGADAVFDDPKDMEPYIKGSTPVPQRMPNYVVSVKNAAEAQKVVQMANEQKMPIIPSSSCVHSRDIVPDQGGIVLDLRQMKQISRLDTRNRKITIEAGVTWAELVTELKKHQLMTMNPLLPHAHGSVLTSFLEREPWLNPVFEYGEPILSMELIWPTGELFRTGTASTVGYPNNLAEGCYPYGPGPLDPMRLLQGAQGTMGIATWANIKTEYLPTVNKSFLIPFDRVEDLATAIYAIQRKRIGRECFALNSLNLASILAKEWPKDFEALRKALPPWSLLLILSGPRWLPEEKIAYEEESLQEIRSSVFPFTQILDVVPGVGRAQILPDLFRNPWPEDTTYWKFRYKGSCAELFFITKLEKAAAFVTQIRRLAGIHGYNPNEIGIYIQPLEYAAGAHVEFDFYYDGKDVEEMAMIENMFAAAVEEALRLEAHFTRPYGKLTSDLVYEKAGSYTRVLKKIKETLDPNNIMNPGALCF